MITVAKCRCGNSPKGTKIPRWWFIATYIVQCKACGIGFVSWFPNGAARKWNRFQSSLYKRFNEQQFKNMRRKINNNLNGKPRGVK